MFEVDYDDRFVEGLFGADPNAISPTSARANDVRGIRQHEELVIGS